MRKIFGFIFVFMPLFFFGKDVGIKDLYLMPYPQKVELKSGLFKIDESFGYIIYGPYSRRVLEETENFIKKLSKRTDIEFSLKNRVLKIKYDETVKKLSPFIDESYRLKIEKRGIFLSAKTDIGILRGLQTLLQLTSMNEKGYFFPNIVVYDFPRFSWRGLLIDTSRHFFSIETLKRSIDAMAFLKMNVLHLHLSDDQAFRLECRSFPRLHTVGSNGRYYTQVEMRKLIDYADRKGIRIVPEFDIPGHTTSWILSYPELGTLKMKYKREEGFGVKDPVFDPTKKSVYKFLKKFFKEVSRLFPDDYIHIGGDEVNGKHWSKSERIKRFMRKKGIKDFHELQAYFNKKIIKILKKYGKKVIGWDEIYSPELPSSQVLIQSWRGKETLYKTAKQGYYSILSNGYYIDLFKSAEEHYLNDPVPSSTGLSSKEKKYILGGEATMWAELIDEETIDSRIWPRTAAIAERFWSNEALKDVRFMYKRLKKINYELEEYGLKHIKNQDMLLRRIIGFDDAFYFKVFINFVEPVEGYKRHKFRKYTVKTPLSSIVDAAIPDPIRAKEFEYAVSDYINSYGRVGLDVVLSVFINWRENYPYIYRTFKSIPQLSKYRELVEDFNKVVEIGYYFVSRRGEVDEDWIENSKKVLFSIEKKNYGELELLILKPVKILINSGIKKRLR